MPSVTVMLNTLPPIRRALSMFALAVVVVLIGSHDHAQAQGLAVDDLDSPSQPTPSGDAAPSALPTSPALGAELPTEGVNAKSCAQINRQQLIAGLIPAGLGLMVSVICLLVLVTFARPGPFLRVVVAALIGALVAPMVLAIMAPAPTASLAECLSSPLLRSEMWIFTSKALGFLLAAAASGVGFVVLFVIFKPFYNMFRARR